MRRALILTVLLASSGCAAVPSPRAVEQADAAARSPAALEAKTHAAQTWALAEKRRMEAHAALEDGPPAFAQFLAEEAMATYDEGAALARVAKAARRAAAAEAEGATLEKELASVDGALRAVTADVEGLELRLRVAQGAEPPGASKAASPEREAARRDAARGMLAQGQILCGAARLLGAGTAAAAPAPSEKAPEDPASPPVVTRDLLEAEGKLKELAAALEPAGAARPTPIDLATRARAACLSVLTRTRRQASTPGGADQASSADALLGELAAMGERAFSPTRDERGVVVSLRDVFEGEEVGARARSLLEKLDRVAAAHPRFAVAVVVHSDKAVPAKDRARWDAKASKVASRFASVAEARRFSLFAGDALPVTLAKQSGNARVEIIFVAPEAL